MKSDKTKLKREYLKTKDGSKRYGSMIFMLNSAAKRSNTCKDKAI